MMWRNTRTGTIYSEQWYDAGPEVPYTVMRKASTRKLSTVLKVNLEEYTPDGGLAFDDELPIATILDPNAGEPAADPGEPDHVDLLEPAEPALDRRELLRSMAQEGQADGLHDVRPDEVPARAPGNVRLPAVHGDLRGLTYNVGSAIAVLLEAPGNEANLRVAILMLGDEIERLRS